MEEGWKRTTVDRKAWSSELQLRKTILDPITNEERPRWILASSQPDLAPDGSLRSVLGAIIDITEQKTSAENALESQKIFRRFSDLAPGGLVIMDSDGKITYANDQWFEISGHPHDESAFATPISWMKIIHESSMDEFKTKWDALMGPDHSPLGMELKSSKPWENHIGGMVENNERWILAQAVPEIGEDGSLIRIMGCKFVHFHCQRTIET